MLGKLGQLYNMYLQFVAVYPPPFILPQMETGIIFLIFLKQDKVQYPYMDAFSKNLIAFSCEYHI